VVGLGEMGQWVAGALLKLGLTVVPANRGDDLARILMPLAPATPVIVATGENVLVDRLRDIPLERADDVVLLQNGTFERDLVGTPVTVPTWCVVWTLRKRGLAQVAGRPTASHGRHAELLTRAFVAVGEPACTLETPADCAIESAAKFAFILAIGGVGLTHDGPLRTALENRCNELDTAVRECLPITLAMAGAEFPHDLSQLENRVMAAMKSMASMPIKGSSAVPRLRRTLGFAQTFDLPHTWLDSVLAAH
jgi:ketopantoate reductase